MSKKTKQKKTTSKVKSKSKPKFTVSKFEGKLNFSTSDNKLLTKERNRVYQIRHRLQAKLKQAKNDTQKRLVRTEIQRTTRYLDKIKKELTGTYKFKGKRFREESYEIRGGSILVENIYKWDIHKAIDSLLNSGRFTEFVIDGAKYSGDSPIEVLYAVDDLETEADLTGQYFMRLTTNFNAWRITVSL